MYYSIENKTDKEVGNVYPQASCVSIDLAHQIQFDSFSYLDSELLFELHPKAKLTDVLSQAAISADGLLISNKVKELLNSFNLMRHQYYKCIVKDLKGNSDNYFWLHLSDYGILDKLDYQKSKFYTTKYGFREEEITIQSYEEYKILKKQLGKMCGISSDLIKLNKDFDFSLDLFNVPLFGKTTYITEALAKKLLDTNVTGLLIDKTQFITI